MCFLRFSLEILESHISKAFKRLAKTGAASYTEVIDNVANTTVNITREAKDSVLDVVTHVAGKSQFRRHKK